MIIRDLKFILQGDFSKYEAKPDIISQVFGKFMEARLQLIPGTFQQVNPPIGTFERMMFNNSSENFSVEIALDRINIKKLIIDKKHYNVSGQTDEFVRNAKKIIKAISETDISTFSCSRVSLVVDVIHETEEELPLVEVYRKLNNELPNYDAEDIVEWSTSAAKRKQVNINSQTEELNVITEISRTRGEYTLSGKASYFDTIQSRYDINTLEDNQSLRINSSFAEDFVDQSILIFNKYFDDVQELINDAK